jgi:hypothetical protein
MSDSIPSWMFAFGLLLLMILANEIGFRLGNTRHNRESEISRSVSGLLKGSILGLVAFLMAFAFSNTSSRFDSRRQIVLNEANALGTCYLRAGLLQDEQSQNIKSILRGYTEQRMALFERGADSEVKKSILSKMDDLMNQLWTEVELAARADVSLAHMAMIVPAANDVIDMHGTRSWATKGHLQPAVLIVLIACVLISSILIGHSSGQSTVRHLGLWISFNLLFAIVLFVVLDYDRPRQGFIQIDHSPFIELLQSMKN